MEKAFGGAQGSNEPFVLVVPQGTTDASVADQTCWDAGDCCCNQCVAENPVECFVNPTESSFEVVTVPDVAFLQQVIADTVAASETKIDTKRIYLAGHSNGCMMAQRFAAEMSQTVAAVCCHSGVRVDNIGDGADASSSSSYNPTPVWIVFGDEDNIVPYEGGGALGANFPSALDNLASWAEANQCTDYAVVNDTSATFATHIYSGCAPGNTTTVEMVQIFGAGHFPYKETNIPNVAETDIDTTQLAMEFCFQYSNEAAPVLPPPTTTTTTNGDGTPPIVENPATDTDGEPTTSPATEEPTSSAGGGGGWAAVFSILLLHVVLSISII
ncbi:MAG: hypothetical protein SGARI_002331 [Bacillariaceae sp.]